MIPAESRMREIRTSGSTSGGVETDRMGAGLSTKRKRGQEAPDPTRHRATPRLYVRRGRRAFLVGAKPTQQLSFRLVAARAVHGGNDMD